MTRSRLKHGVSTLRRRLLIVWYETFVGDWLRRPNQQFKLMETREVLL